MLISKSTFFGVLCRLPNYYLFHRLKPRFYIKITLIFSFIRDLTPFPQAGSENRIL
jgi:hypothetical protein